MSSISSNFFFIFLQENLLNKIVLKQNKSNLAVRLCLPNDVMTTVSSLGQNALRIISPDSSKEKPRYRKYGSTWSWSRIVLSLFRAGGFYKVFPKYCRFLDRQVWRGENNWRVLLRVREEIPERIIRYTCKWKRLRSVLLWRPDCVRPLPVHGNSPWCHGVSRHLYLWISFWHKRIVWQNVLTFYSPAACSNTVKFLTQN